MTTLVCYAPLILKGIGVTLSAWSVTVFFSASIGTMCGTLSSGYLGFALTSWIVKIYAFIAKGIPAYVQILIAYFVLPSLIGFSLPPFVAACGALAFCSGGYVTDIIRAGIDSVPRGQWEAAYVLGYSRITTIRRIIFPQALRTVLPALLGEVEKLLKSTSLLATIGVTELTRAGQNIISRELNPFAVYIMIACIYLFFSAVINITLYFLSKRRGRYGIC